MSDDFRPTVSIVTPSLNQARFLPAAIESVLSQSYPKIEYLIMDGGSTDGTLDVLKRYGNRLRFRSAPDGGQAAAVNEGFARSSGEIFAFLNADDVYLPGAVEAAVEEFCRRPSAAAVYGEAYLIDERGERIAKYPTRKPDLHHLSLECTLCQPAVFLRSTAFREAGMLDVKLQFALDYDLWIRLAGNAEIASTSCFLAGARVHPEAKTVRRRRDALRETILVMKRHFGFAPFSWIYEYSCAALGSPFVFRAPPPRSASAYALSVALGSVWNIAQLSRYWEESLRPVRSGWRRYPTA